MPKEISKLAPLHRMNEKTKIKRAMKMPEDLL
jgi:hypothetical protein